MSACRSSSSTTTTSWSSKPASPSQRSGAPLTTATETTSRGSWCRASPGESTTATSSAGGHAGGVPPPTPTSTTRYPKASNPDRRTRATSVSSRATSAPSIITMASSSGRVGPRPDLRTGHRGTRHERPPGLIERRSGAARKRPGHVSASPTFARHPRSTRTWSAPIARNARWLDSPETRVCAAGASVPSAPAHPPR